VLQPALPRHHLATATAALRETPGLTPALCISGTVMNHSQAAQRRSVAHSRSRTFVSRRREARHLGSESAARFAAQGDALQPTLPRHHLATATAALRETPGLTPALCISGLQ